MRKVFITDLDGTLLTKDEMILESSKEAIEMLKQAGYEIMIATGRVERTMRKYQDELCLENPMITGNGAVILNNDLTTIYERYLEEDDLDSIFNIINQLEIPYLVLTTKKVYYNYTNDFILKKLDKDFENMKKIENKDVYKINNILKVLLVVEDIMDKKEGLTMMLRDNLELEVVSSNKHLIDIMKNGVTKAEAINIYQKNNKIDYLVTIGDNENDVEMLLLADYSIALGNGVKQAKEAATYVTKKSNNDGGFYEGVVELLKNNKIS